VLTVVLVLVVPPVALMLARRAASHPAVLLARDLLVAAFLLYRAVFRLVRSLVRFAVGEVRSWRTSS
jgi:hypothetical protein